jgi:hypothetical protein
MIFGCSSICILSLLSYDRLSRLPTLFKSFTGLTVQDFDDIHNKKIAKRYGKYEIQRFYHQKEKLLEKENLDQADNLSWMLETDF